MEQTLFFVTIDTMYWALGKGCRVISVIQYLLPDLGK